MVERTSSCASCEVACVVRLFMDNPVFFSLLALLCQVLSLYSSHLYVDSLTINKET